MATLVKVVAAKSADYPSTWFQAVPNSSAPPSRRNVDELGRQMRRSKSCGYKWSRIAPTELMPVPLGPMTLMSRTLIVDGITSANDSMFTHAIKKSSPATRSGSLSL
jgi:hypothetical protein